MIKARQPPGLWWVASSWAILVFASPNLSAFVVIPREGALPPIWHDVNASPAITAAANDLAETLAQMASREVPQIGTSASGKEPGIHLSAPRDDKRPNINSRFFRRPRAIAYNVSSISRPKNALGPWEDPHAVREEPWVEQWQYRASKDRLHLWGNDAEATVSAVYWFLQRYGGVRWYFPGELGQSVPKRDLWKVKFGSAVAMPGFLSRQLLLYGSNGHEGLWARRNLLREHFAFNHQMHRIVTADDFPRHPDWFPLDGNERRRPVGDLSHSMQPNLLSDGVVERTIDATNEYFVRNAEALSFSIALNDNVHFGDYPVVVDPRKQRKVYRAHFDYSDLVFGFSNRVAAALARNRPGKYLGALAYAAWENVPSFPVASNIVPYIAADRSQWYDPNARTHDVALARAWTAHGPRIVGAWDYAYGAPYLIPRIYLRVLADSVKALHEAGIRAYFAEMSPIWGYDAPKAWLAAQLLVNPMADPEELLEAFFSDLYGAAAPAMRGFFDRCEAVWMRQRLPSRWIKYYRDTHQAFLLQPEDIEALATFLAEADNRAASVVERERIAVTRRAFEATRLFLEMQFAADELSSQVAKRDYSDRMFNAAMRYRGLRFRFINTLKAIESDPLNQMMGDLTFPLSETPVFGLIDAAINTPTHDAPEILPWLVDFADSADETDWSRLTTAIQYGIVLGTERFQNPGFMYPSPRFATDDELTLPAGWKTVEIPNPCRRFRRIPEAARTTAVGLEIVGASIWRIAQPVQTNSGERIRFSGWFRGSVSLGSRVALRVHWFDKSNRILQRTSDARLLPGEHEQWSQLTVFADAPDHAVAALAILTVENQGPSDFLHAADFSFRSLLQME